MTTGRRAPSDRVSRLLGGELGGKHPLHPDNAGSGLERVRVAGLPLLQAALAAGLGWFLAHDVIGHRSPIFAPIAALLILADTPGRRTSRVLATTIGAVIGIAIGDLLVATLGTGPIQVAIVAFLATATAIVLGAGPTLATHAGIAGVLIATVQAPHGIYSSAGVSRLVDVLIGGGASLTMSVVLPSHPLKTTRAAAAALFSELSGTLDDVAAALDSHDAEVGERALERARTLDAHVVRLRQAIELAEETAHLVPFYRGARAPVARHRIAAEKLELAARDVRVLARAAVRAIELEPPTPAELSLAIRELASAVRGLAAEIERRDDGTDASRSAVAAARRATAVAERRTSMPVGAIVAQVRSTAADLLEAIGVERSEAVGRVRQVDDGLIAEKGRGSGS
jgi:uncharacterized membrane protein YgaE (UPF0421/DUF939 family)